MVGKEGSYWCGMVKRFSLQAIIEYHLIARHCYMNWEHRDVNPDMFMEYKHEHLLSAYTYILWQMEITTMNKQSGLRGQRVMGVCELIGRRCPEQDTLVRWHLEQRYKGSEEMSHVNTGWRTLQ